LHSENLAHFTFDSVNLFRIGGLPVETIASVRSADAFAWAHSALAQRDAQESLAEELSEDLSTRIGLLPAGLAKKAAILFRRDLYTGRLTAAAGRGPAAEESIPDWRDVHRRAVTAGDDVARADDLGSTRFSTWVDEERRGLVRALDNERFVQGLSISAPDAWPSIAGYRDKVRAGQAGPRSGKIERPLLSYLLRAATKTSPFSTFAVTALTRIGRDGSDDAWERLDQDWTLNSQWNVYVVARLFDGITENRQWIRHLPIARSKAVRRVSDDRMEVGRILYDFSNGRRGAEYAAADESVVTLRQVDLLSLIEDAIDAGAADVASIGVAIVRSTRVEIGTAEALVATLLRLGFLTAPTVQLHPHTASPARLIKAVQAMDSLGSIDAADLMIQYSAEANAVALEGDPWKRTATIARSKDLIERLFTLAGVDADVPRSPVLEDCVLRTPVREAPAGMDAAVEDDLRALADVVPLLDDTEIHRSMMHGFFQLKFGVGGRCDDLSAFLWSFRRELLDGYLRRRENPTGSALHNDPWLKIGGAWRWVDARSKLTNWLSDLPRDADHSVDLREALTADGPVFANTSPASYPYRHFHVFAQQLRDSAPSLVINSIYGSPGFALSRFTTSFGADYLRTESNLNQQAKTAGVVLAELTGTSLYTNLNLHAPLVDAEIVIPGAPSGGAVASFEFDDLAIVDLPSEDRIALIDKRTGTEILPVYHGYLVVNALPLLARLILLFGPATNPALDLWRGVDRDRAGAVSVMPRLTLGSLVLARKTWRTTTAELPQEPPLSSPSYLTWIRWFRDEGVPQQSYARTTVESGVGVRGKPRFVDTSGVLMLQAAAHEWLGADGGGGIEFAEALPALEDTLASTTMGRHASETIFGFDLIRTAQAEGTL
jgi:hypothetical protein